ncbi:hypothetical protein ElyMa_001373500 [Elysia marginata]|uniref:PiggyBac transposable element-derived protein domain-containing protein n=1 Tax=Elysia marginata TaxID=1093978 RepID=A0AAV4IS88_9GAST|nr:hypothetical protein ElyMa_001373500 [Elysia marginata]
MPFFFLCFNSEHPDYLKSTMHAPIGMKTVVGATSRRPNRIVDRKTAWNKREFLRPGRQPCLVFKISSGDRKFCCGRRRVPPKPTCYNLKIQIFLS